MTYYLYRCPNGYFEMKEVEENNYIISSFNKAYMYELTSFLNFLKMKYDEISNDKILEEIIGIALEQDKPCGIKFNKDNQI